MLAYNISCVQCRSNQLAYSNFIIWCYC